MSFPLIQTRGLSIFFDFFTTTSLELLLFELDFQFVFFGLENYLIFDSLSTYEYRERKYCYKRFEIKRCPLVYGLNCNINYYNETLKYTEDHT